MTGNKATQNQWTIHQLIADYGYSYRDLAPLVGYSASMICRLLKGERRLRSRHKIRFAQVFNIDEKNIIWPIK